jgi:hypothetical protein
MSNQQSDQGAGQQGQSAEIQAHNAVAHALSELNQAQTSNNDRRRVIQLAQEQLDRAHQQLAEARVSDSTNTNEESLS